MIGIEIIIISYIIITNKSKDLIYNVIVLSTILMDLLFIVNSWISIYIILEGYTIIIYVLLIIDKIYLKRINEYIIKYIIMSMINSLIFILAILYSIYITGDETINTGQIYLNVFFIIYISFKLGTIPYSSYINKLYGNLNLNILFLLNLITKPVFLYLLYIIYIQSTAWNVLLFIAILTIIYGTIQGFLYLNIYNLISNSSIIYTGLFIIILLLANKIIYTNLIIYIINLINLFALLYITPQFPFQRISPFIYINYLISLCSFIGIPPLSGFYYKWYLISSLFYNEFYMTALFIILSALISSFFYFYPFIISAFSSSLIVPRIVIINNNLCLFVSSTTYFILFYVLIQPLLFLF